MNKKKVNRRGHISKSLREKIWKYTKGRCHICGKKLRRNAKHGEYGRGHIGHIVAHARGGSENIGNLLPTCKDCNLILKHSGSKRIKKILRLGVWGESEIRGRTKLGKQLAMLYRNRKLANVRKRK